MKFLSLVRAVLSEDMNLFVYRTKSTDSRLKRLLFPLGLALVIMLSVGVSVYYFIESLSETGDVGLVPTVLIIMLSVVGLFEGVYKSSSILFECRDNDLLFSLPIEKYKIFTLRVIKLIIFQFIYNMIFMLPTFIVYVTLMHPAPVFYPISVLMLFLTPLIPTAISVIVGYIVKNFSFNFRHQKLAQIFLTFAAIIIVMTVVSNWEAIAFIFADHAAGISSIAGQLYYPAGAYARLIESFSWGDFTGVILACVTPLVLAIYFCSRHYFEVISKTAAKTFEPAATKIEGKKTGKTVALIKKEISRMFASPVFVVNTLFGPILLIFGVVVISFNMNGVVNMLSSNDEIMLTLDDIMLLLPLFYIGALVLMCAMTSITSSMISIEGKSFNITKSLPVSSFKILLSKLLASLVVSLPLFLFADLIFVVKFTLSLLYTLLIFILPVLALSLSGLIGLLVNLKYPKMDANNDTEVVKQSVSSFIGVLFGMIFGVTSVAILVALSILTKINAAVALAILYIVAILVLLRILATWGVKKFRNIES